MIRWEVRWEINGKTSVKSNTTREEARRWMRLIKRWTPDGNARMYRVSETELADGKRILMVAKRAR